MKYKLIMFDFDGTLADSFGWFTQSLDQLAIRHGFKRVTPAQQDQLRRRDVRTVLDALGVPFWKMPAMAAEFRRMMASQIHEIRLFDGVDRLLRKLSEQGIMLAVVSSNSRQNIRTVLGPENAARIRYYACGVPVLGKAARLKTILQKSGVRRGQALFVGDELRDAEAAQKAKIAFGAVSWGYTDLAALLAHSPREVFRRMNDIAALAG